MPEIAADPKHRILLVDDDELVAGTLRSSLDLRGSACDVAHDREHAVGYMEAHDYGVVVVDPYLTGSLAGAPASLLADIRKLQPEAAIVVLTAYDSLPLQLLCRAYRVGRTVAKPQPVLALTEIVLETQTRLRGPASDRE